MDQQIGASTENLSVGKINQEEGKEYIYLYSAAAVTKNVLYWHSTVTTDGLPTAAAITLGAKDCKGYVVVATETTAAAGNSWFLLKGYSEDAILDTDTYVALDMVGLYDSVCTPSAATTVTPDDFAVALTAGATTTPGIYLLGREITVGGA